MTLTLAATAGSQTFVSLLTPGNNSGVVGLARLILSGNVLTVDAVATGLTLGQIHPFHLHGFVDGRLERTPVIADDADRDGFIETLEGESSAYGPVLAGLQTNGEAQAFLEQSPFYPVADANGVVKFNQTYILDPAEPDDAFILGQLQTRTAGRFLEFHGLQLAPGAGAGTGQEVNGIARYEPQVPVAAGPLIPVASGGDGIAPLLTSELFTKLALSSLSLLQPYSLRPDGGGPAAPEDPALPGFGQKTNSAVALLLPSNGSGVQGTAVVTLDPREGLVTLEVNASGLTPGVIHAQHIHGFSDDSPSLLPNFTLDADRDGFVEDPEGAAVVGPIILAGTASGSVSQVRLSPDFPVAAANGNLVFRQTYDLDLTNPQQAAIFQDLQQRLVGREFQIHGLAVPAGDGDGTPFEVNGGGAYIPELPVANGVSLPALPGLTAPSNVLDLLI